LLPEALIEAAEGLLLAAMVIEVPLEPPEH
jgi:hypothetical protein